MQRLRENYGGSRGIRARVLAGSLELDILGGLVNIPIARLRGEAVSGLADIVVFGVRYRLPIIRRPQPTILAVNLGGAVIPTAVSILLLIKDGIWWQAAVAVTVVAVLVHAIARPVWGLGVAVPGSFRRC